MPPSLVCPSRESLCVQTYCDTGPPRVPHGACALAFLPRSQTPLTPLGPGPCCEHDRVRLTPRFYGNRPGGQKQLPQPPSEWEREAPGTHASQRRPTRGLHQVTRPPGRMPQGYCPQISPGEPLWRPGGAGPWHALPAGPGRRPKCPVAASPAVQPAACTWSAASLASPVTQFGAGSSPAGQPGSRAAAQGIGRVASGHVSRVEHVWAQQGPEPGSVGTLLLAPCGPRWPALTQHRDGFNPQRRQPQLRAEHGRT